MAASKENCTGGYVVDVINKSDKKKFDCMLCLSIVRKATHGCTKHVFCFECLQEYIESNERKEIQYCPGGCQKTFNTNELSSNDPYDQLINQIECKCSFCSWEGQLLDFIQVHNGQCEEKVIPCNLCSMALKRKYMDHHLKDECPHRPVACRGCGKNFPFVDHLKHEESCDDIKVQCSFTSFGCNVEDTRRNMIAHENNSNKQHLSLFAKYFTDENKQLKEETTQLNEENKQLKDETKQLKEENKQFKEETKQFKEETQQLKEENKQLKEETKQLKEETQQLKEETKQIKEETKQLKEENKQLKEENKQVKEETKQLKEETKQFKEENKQLKEETKQLKKETEQFKEETKQFKEETQQLKEENKQFKEETKQLKEVTTLLKEETKQLKEESIKVKEENKQIKEKVELLKMNTKVSQWKVNIQQILMKEPANNFFHFPSVDEMHIKKINSLTAHELFDCFSKNNFTWIIEDLVTRCALLNNYENELHKLFSSTKTIKFNRYGNEYYFFHIEYFKSYDSWNFSVKKDENIFYIEKYNNNYHFQFYISNRVIEINNTTQIDITKPGDRFKVSTLPNLPPKYFFFGVLY